MKSIKFILLLLGINLITFNNDCISQVISGIICENYYQEIKTEIKLPDQAENEVIKLFRNTAKKVFLMTRCKLSCEAPQDRVSVHFLHQA